MDELEQLFNQAQKNRPNREEAIQAIYIARIQLESALKTINDIFTRENQYNMYKYLYENQNK